MTGWELAEYEHDIAREQLRADRLATRRANRFWTPLFVIALTALIAIAAGIQGGAFA